jgi:hypothetical protein
MAQIFKQPKKEKQMATFASLTLEQKLAYAHAKKARVQKLIALLERAIAATAAPTAQEITAAAQADVTADDIIAGRV